MQPASRFASFKVSPERRKLFGAFSLFVADSQGRLHLPWFEGCLRRGALRDGEAAEEGSPGQTSRPRGGGACLGGPAVAVGYGLRPSRDCAALLGLGARRRTHCATLRSDKCDGRGHRDRCTPRRLPPQRHPRKSAKNLFLWRIGVARRKVPRAGERRHPARSRRIHAGQPLRARAGGAL